jgi:hypothetical protein
MVDLALVEIVSNDSDRVLEFSDKDSVVGLEQEPTRSRSRASL